MFRKMTYSAATYLSKRGFATRRTIRELPAVGAVSGVPPEIYDRKALIFSPARTAAQQGVEGTIWGHSPSWRIEFENSEKWENQLIGWTSTADPLENTFRSGRVQFYTKEQAVAFCEKHGWRYEVLGYNERKIARTKRFSTYGDNFSMKRAGIPDISTFRSMRESK